MPGDIIKGVIGGAASIFTSKSNNKAIDRATQAQSASDAQQIGFQREIYGKNEAALSPFMQRGNAAGNQINALLGLGGGIPMPGPITGYGSGTFNMDGTPATTGTAGPAQPAHQSALNAYEMFKQSTGYQSRLQEGQRGQGAMYSALGTYQSGARDKALARFNQDYASREFGNYVGMLGNQQGVGFAGASALAGVGQGFADRMGAISQNGADTAAQAAIARAQNSGALMTGLAGSLGTAVGALSSYKKQQPVAGGWGTPGLY